MASASAAARLRTLACPRTARLNRILPAQQAIAQRYFGTSTMRWKRARKEELPPLRMEKLDQEIAELSTTERLRYLDEMARTGGFGNIEQYMEDKLDGARGFSAQYREVLDELDQIENDKPNKQSFWFDDEDPYTNTEEETGFNEDEMTPMGHAKLEQIREMRQYARLAVWELPLLSKLAKPFTPPADDQVLRWRFTSYMGEAHPAEKKVVVQFAPDDLKLTPVQTAKLKKLAGARYNPETELIKMSCESFEHPAQNQRYLSDLVDTLIAAAKDPADTFEDIPLDTRHHRTTTKPKFPREWVMTEERRAQLAGIREQAALADAQRSEAGGLVDGAKRVDEFVMARVLEEQEKAKLAELEAAPKAGARGDRVRERVRVRR